MHRLAHHATTNALAGLLLLAATPAVAGVPTDQLKASIDEVIKILEDPGLKSEASSGKRRAAIRQIANNIFDFGEAAKRSLGRHWQRLAAADREEFTALFTELLERAYITKIEQYSGERVSYAGDSGDTDLATVKTRLTAKSGTDIPVDYRMLRKGDRWLVYDISIEGLSLVANYRGQFNKIIETASYEDLVKRMKARSNEFRAPGESGSKKES